MEHSYIGPAFEDAKVRDAMRVGVITCRPETKLDDVAAMMIGYDAHSIVVADLPGDGDGLGIVTSLDLARHARRAAEHLSSVTAGEVATANPVTIGSDEPLQRAAELMAEHGISHLIVVQPDTQRPAGMVSARGIAAAVAFGR